MVTFGFGVILCFIIAIAFIIYTTGLVFLFYGWPILIGIWIGLFRRNKDGYETQLSEKEGEKIYRIIDTICKKTGQKKPHKIVITEGSGVAVSGFFRKKVIIGMVAIKFMDEEDLFTILAHEYGHFANKDTVFGYLTYRIQNFIEIQKEINRQNMVSYLFFIYIPTWFFFWLFSKYFSLISLWYSRRVEFRADNFASNLVGQQKFANTLIKYCIISDIFEDVVPRYVLHFLQQDKQIVNLYEFIKPIYSEKTIKQGFNLVLSAESSWWSTHPSISERMEMLGINKVDIQIDNKLKPLLVNQLSYEKEASTITTHKMAYWMNLVALAQAQQNQQITEDNEFADEDERGVAYYCAKCGTRAASGDIHCRKCKQLLASDGACVKKELK